MHKSILLLAVVCFLIPGRSYAQRSKPALVCKRPVLNALKPRPRLTYECNDQLNDYDEKILKLPERVSAIETLVTDLTALTDADWWSADTVDLSVCDLTRKPVALNREQRRDFLGDDYVFWLFGNSRIRLVLIPDPCYQTEYGGSNAFLLYRDRGRVVVTQVLDGYFSRADNSVSLNFARLGGEEVIEISTGSGGLSPTLTNYYFSIDPATHHAVPKNLFRGEHGPTNEISSAMLFNLAAANVPLKVIRGQTLSPSFIIYEDDPNGKIDDNDRTFSRKILRWNGKIYR